VLRCQERLEAIATIDQLCHCGVRHVELAWQDHPGWVDLCLSIQQRYPELLLGAASVCSRPALEASAAAGLSYAMSPILDPELLQRAEQLELILVPGVMTPTEVDRARRLGCRLVKLFPAASLGPQYWQQLQGPLGALPFCIAAGGLKLASVPEWLAAGVDAVALGAALFARPDGASRPDPGLSGLLQWLDARAL
jgi:2-dehydro-3-deoxyphosphogluconate aldolase/(4S)-4-hydroxy-2-oxoglutarate aldolase